MAKSKKNQWSWVAWWTVFISGVSFTFNAALSWAKAEGVGWPVPIAIGHILMFTGVILYIHHTRPRDQDS